MDKQKIDHIFKNKVLDAKNHYSSNAYEAKDRIWQKVNVNKKNKHYSIIRLLVAACVILLFLSFGLLISNYSTKKSYSYLLTATEELSNKTKEQAKLLSKLEKNEYSVKEYSRDTVYVVNNKIVYKTIEKTRLIKDTVLIKQIEIVEKIVDSENLISHNESSSDFCNQIILIDNKNQKISNKKKFRVKFWGNMEQSSFESLAISTKL